MDSNLQDPRTLFIHSSLQSCDANIPTACPSLMLAIHTWPIWTVHSKHSRFVSSLQSFVRVYQINYHKIKGPLVTSEIKRSGNCAVKGGCIVFVPLEPLESESDCSTYVQRCFGDTMSSCVRWCFTFDDMYRIAVCALLGLCGFHPPTAWDKLPFALKMLAHAIPAHSTLMRRLQLALIPDQLSWGAYACVTSDDTRRSERDPVSLTLTAFVWLQEALQLKRITTTLHHQLWHQFVAQVQRKGFKFPVSELHSAHASLKASLDQNDRMRSLERQLEPVVRSFVVHAKRMLLPDPPEALDTSSTFNLESSKFRAFMRVSRCLDIQRGPIVTEFHLCALQYHRLDMFLTYLHRYAGGALYNAHCAKLKRLQAVSIIHPQFHGCVVSCAINATRRTTQHTISTLLHSALASEFICTEIFERRKNTARTLLQAPRDSVRLLCLLSAVQLSRSPVALGNFHSLPLASNLALSLTQVSDLSSMACIWKQVAWWITANTITHNQSWTEWESIASSILRVWATLATQSSNTSVAADLLRQFARLRILNGNSIALVHPPNSALAIVGKHNPVLHKELEAMCRHAKPSLVGVGDTARKCIPLTAIQGCDLIRGVLQLPGLTLPEFTVLMQGTRCTASQLTALSVGSDATLLAPFCLRSDAIQHTTLDTDEERHILLRMTLQKITFKSAADLTQTLVHASRIMCVAMQLLEIGAGRIGYAWPENAQLHDVAVFRMNSGQFIPLLESVIVVDEQQISPAIADVVRDVLSGNLISPEHIMQHDVDLLPQSALDHMPPEGWNKLTTDAMEPPDATKISVVSPSSVKRMLTTNKSNLQAHMRGNIATFDFTRNKKPKKSPDARSSAIHTATPTAGRASTPTAAVTTSNTDATASRTRAASSVFANSHLGTTANFFDDATNTRSSAISILERFSRS